MRGGGMPSKRSNRVPGPGAPGAALAFARGVDGAGVSLRAFSGSPVTAARRAMWKSCRGPSPRIAQTWAMSGAPSLGVGASRAILQMRTVADCQCATGAVLAFDVDDRYAFDIDEPVSVTVHDVLGQLLEAVHDSNWDARTAARGWGVPPSRLNPARRSDRSRSGSIRARLAGQGTRGCRFPRRGGARWGARSVRHRGGPLGDAERAPGRLRD